jgi:NADP-dependent 3-hydroxy acid dehydrogenase YdfG
MAASGAPGPLAGKTALVTGASRGIGRATALALGAAGARVVLMGRNAQALAEVRAQLKDAAIHVADFADIDAVCRAIDALRGDLPTLDVLVNNAGAFRIADLELTRLDDFEDTLRVNLTAPLALMREALSAMRRRGRGDIVTIGSIADHQAFAGNAAYAASKFGARGLHGVLREETRGSGVRATLISPGPVDTTLWDEIDPDSKPGFTPRAKMLDAAAVADAVLWVVTRPASVNVDELRLSRS